MVKFRSGRFMLSFGACTVHWRENLASLMGSSVVCGLQGRRGGGWTVKKSLHCSAGGEGGREGGRSGEVERTIITRKGGRNESE